MTEDGGGGWRAAELLPRVAAGALSVPVVVGFVALGAAVVVARSLRDVVRETWSWIPPRRNGGDGDSQSDAA
jgi:hypothetical protein